MPKSMKHFLHPPKKKKRVKLPEFPDDVTRSKYSREVKRYHESERKWYQIILEGNLIIRQWGGRDAVNLLDGKDYNIQQRSYINEGDALRSYIKFKQAKFIKGGYKCTEKEYKKRQHRKVTEIPASVLEYIDGETFETLYGYFYGLDDDQWFQFKELLDSALYQGLVLEGDDGVFRKQ